MKKIEAIIRPAQLEEVKQALAREGINGMTISEVHGFGRQRGHEELYRGAAYPVRLVPKLKIEVIVEDGKASTLIEAIRHSAATGRIGDGKIWVSPLEETIRIRTGERREFAV